MKLIFWSALALVFVTTGCATEGGEAGWHEGGYPGDGLGPGGDGGVEDDGADDSDDAEADDPGGVEQDTGVASDPPADYGPDNTWSHATEDDVPAGLQGTGWGPGDVAYNFTLQDQYGDEVELYQFYGKVVVLDIFAEW